MGLLSYDNMGMTGYAVRDSNFRFRFLLIIFMGVLAFGAVLYWRSRLFVSTEYIDVPMAKHLQKGKVYQNYNLE